MNLKQLFVAMPAALFVLGSGVANRTSRSTMRALSPAWPTSGTRRSLKKHTSGSTMLADA